ncbi:F-box/WD repeat-containing protein 7-like [Limulus polyphemus]|uniref:F-box/WD repeat-containing protein 7-like n=1 Tax=Limulus polyphemus TaxID=6850 RepID=A0ABM1RWW6_LIMPO|nr:F-box/WD repeat-containing protein 7-like [Limulus polyphemus]
MNICSLPTEIQEKILSFLDGQSLARVQQVCRLWYNLVQNLSEVGEIWKNCCLREIAIDVLRELVGCKEVTLTAKCDTSTCFPVIEESLNINWKSSYQRWFIGGVICHWPYWVKSFPDFDSIPITCVKFAGSWIITGHRNGKVCAWNSLSGELENIITNHLALVTDIELVDMLNRGKETLYDENTLQLSSSCSWIITGHRNGKVCAWNSLSGELENIITNHLALVTDIELVDMLNRGKETLYDENTLQLSSS